MSNLIVEAPVPGAADLASLEPVETIKRRWPVILAGVLTVAMTIGLGRELIGSGIADLRRAVPDSPWFYVVFALLYQVPQTFDYLIFRKLWQIPGSGFGALIRKRIANDVVIGYSGDVYFYAWARRHVPMVAAPFGAVKDVSILSAIAGNAVTLAMLAVALPYGYDLLKPADFTKLAGSAAIIVGMSLPVMLFSRRVFSLPSGRLWWVFAMQCARLLTGSLLIAFAWHFALPAVSIGVWLLLSAGRLLVSRLPFVPNKDLLFANVAILFIGQNHALTELIAVTVAMTMMVHAILLVAFTSYSFWKKRS